MNTLSIFQIIRFLENLFERILKYKNIINMIIIIFMLYLLTTIIVQLFQHIPIIIQITPNKDKKKLKLNN